MHMPLHVTIVFNDGKRSTKFVFTQMELLQHLQGALKDLEEIRTIEIV